MLDASAASLLHSFRLQEEMQTIASANACHQPSACMGRDSREGTEWEAEAVSHSSQGSSCIPAWESTSTGFSMSCHSKSTIPCGS